MLKDRPEWTTPWSVTRALAVRFGGAEHVPLAALERGSLVHEWTAEFDQCNYFNVQRRASPAAWTTPTMPTGLEGYCYAYHDFVETMQPTWLKVESPVENTDLGYHGILDRYGYLNGGSTLCVADIKTGGPRKADRYQLAAYAMACNQSVPVHRLARVGIYIRDDGTWSLKTYDAVMDFTTWMEILNEANEAKEKNNGRTNGTRSDG